MVGGAMAAFDLWEAAVLPALENIKNYFVRRLLLQVPESTPKPVLLSETGLISMKYRIWTSKLIFVNTLKNMQDGTLAKEIFDEQVNRGWPGLAKEATKICQDLELPNIIKERIGKRKWESMVKKGT